MSKENNRNVEQNRFVTCHSCEDDINLQNEPVHEVGGESHCSECFHETYFECNNCDDCQYRDYEYVTDDGDSYCEDCYYDLFTNCVGCDYQMYRDSAEWINDDPHCYDCATERTNVTLDEYGTCHMAVSESFDRNKWKRRVGLEIEAVHDMDDEMETDFYEDNIEIDRNWRIVHDGSINSEGGTGREFVMRGGMQGDELYQAIEGLSDILWSRGWGVNRSCGLHIHIDGSDLDAEHLSSILKVAKMSESIIYKMMPPSRRNGRWCRRIPLSLSEIERMRLSEEHFIEAWYSAFDVRPSMEKYNDSRYCGVNMHSRVVHGSIEFRHHSGTIDPRKIINWIEICQRIVATGIKLAEDKDKFTMKLHNLIEGRKEEFKYFTFKEFCWALDITPYMSDYIKERILKFYDPDIESEYREVNLRIDSGNYLDAC